MRVVAAYSYLTVGGVETVLRGRMDALSAQGVDLHAWFLHDLGGRSVFSGRENRITVGPREALAHYVESNRPDLVLVIDTPEILPALASSPTCPPVAIEFHTPYVDNQTYLGRLEIAPRAVLVPSAYQAAIAGKLLKKNPRTTTTPVIVVPNPLRPEFAAPLVDPMVTPPLPIVSWIGRLDELKNWRGFLELGAGLAELAPPHELWLVGKPSDAETGRAVVEAARRLGVLPQLRWYRGLPHQRVPTLLDLVRVSGGVLTSTSKGESFGMTVAEAMARACAVVTPDLPPFDEFVTPSVGIRYVAGRSNTPAVTAVCGLLTDHERRQHLAAAGRTAILERHAPGPALDVFGRVLRELVR